jgi:Flp pilus assembly protein TadD
MISQSDTTDLRTALFLHREGQVARAANIYRAVLARSPDNSDALHYLGLLEARTGRFERANSLIARSLELQPSNAISRELRDNLMPSRTLRFSNQDVRQGTQIDPKKCLPAVRQRYSTLQTAATARIFATI